MGRSLASARLRPEESSLIETCKLNDVEPYAYLKDVLTRLPTLPAPASCHTENGRRPRRRSASSADRCSTNGPCGNPGALVRDRFGVT